MPSRIKYQRSPIADRLTRQYERADTRADDKAFYASPVWRDLRRRILSANPLCVDCRASGRVTLAAQVHHKIERKRDPSRALDPTNLEPVCIPCHNAKRRRQSPEWALKLDPC